MLDRPGLLGRMMPAPRGMFRQMDRSAGLRPAAAPSTGASDPAKVVLKPTHGNQREFACVPLGLRELPVW